MTAKYGLNEGTYLFPPLANEDLEHVFSYVLNEVQSFKKDHPEDLRFCEDNMAAFFRERFV